jgi:hypothetical protein
MENPKACTVVLDTSDAPEIYHVATFDADGTLVDIIDDYTDLDEAKAAAEEWSRTTKLPLSLRETPYG